MEDVDKKNKPRLSVSDANTTPLLLTRSLQEVSKHMQERLNNSYKDFKLSGSSVDVLFTLLASNKPYSLSPGQLLKKMHITSGTLTTRIDKLEKKGLVKRESKKEDKRSVV